LIITELRIENLRNLAQMILKPHPRLNFIVGDNGAGKTSILESMVVLSRGRSFRTIQATELTGRAGQNFTVFATTLLDDGREQRIGIERTGKHWRARKDNRELTQISQLTRSFPLVLMEPNSHLLVSGTPEVRRKYIDGGVFHVEPGFLDVWARHSRALKQRNAALRSQQTALLHSMDAALIPSAELLSELRKSYTDRIKRFVTRLLPLIALDMGTVELSYFNGWGDGDYATALKRYRDRDLDRGLTQVGPHRADLNLQLGDSPARSVLSRGEQKSLSAVLLLAQAELVAEQGEKPVILLDDLASEFDSARFRAVLELALEKGGQVWVSGTSRPELQAAHRMFHVEHGVLKEMV